MNTTQILIWGGVALAAATIVGLNWFRLKDALSMYRDRKR
jgi:hypothetical protein